MRYTMDITGSGYDVVDFDFCHMFFPVPRQLLPKMTVEFWGLVIHPSGRDEHRNLQRCIDFDISVNNIFIAGYSAVSIECPVQAELFLALYDIDSHDKEFKRDEKGEVVQLSKLWKIDSVEGSREYNFGGILVWPYGDCSLDLHARGPAALEFDTEDCVATKTVMADRAGYTPPELS